MHSKLISDLSQSLNGLKPILTSAKISDTNREGLTKIAADGLAIYEALIAAQSNGVSLDEEFIAAAEEWNAWAQETLTVLTA